MADPPNPQSQIDQLRQEIELLRQELADVRRDRAASRPVARSSPAEPAAAEPVAKRPEINPRFSRTARKVAYNTLAIDAQGLANIGPGLEYDLTPLVGSEASVTVSGYLKADFIYDLDQPQGANFAVDSIVVGAPDREQVQFHARESRVRFIGKAKTGIGAVTTTLEGDFFTTTGGNELISNSHPFRLRHAYAEIEYPSGTKLGFGQTWSNFMTLAASPSTVDFGGVLAVPFVRQPQVRLTKPLGDGLTLVASLESPEFSGTAPGPTASTIGGKAQDKLPDLVVGVHHASKAGYFRGVGVLRSLSFDDGVTDDTATAWGIQGAAAVNISNSVKLKGLVTYGDGVGRYIGVAGGVRDAQVTASDGIDTTEALGVSGGVEFKLDDSKGLNIGGGYVKFDEGAATQSETLKNVHVNLTYQPVPSIKFGGEIMWGDKELFNGASESVLRLQFASMFFF